MAKRTHKILEDLQEIGWENILELKGDFETITLTLQSVDLALDVSVPQDYPLGQPHCDLDLGTTGSRFDTVAKLFFGVRKHMDRLTQFIQIIKQIDDKLWILEKAFNRRRIVLENFCTAVIVIEDPLFPFKVPRITISGPDDHAREYNKRIHSNLSHWSQEIGFIENLSMLLGTTFEKNQESSTKTTFECGICLDFKLLGMATNIVCPNSKCGQSFHSGCLADWFVSLPTTRRSIQHLLGPCPFCNQTLSVSSR